MRLPAAMPTTPVSTHLAQTMKHSKPALALCISECLADRINAHSAHHIHHLRAVRACNCGLQTATRANASGHGLPRCRAVCRRLVSQTYTTSQTLGRAGEQSNSKLEQNGEINWSKMLHDTLSLSSRTRSCSPANFSTKLIGWSADDEAATASPLAICKTKNRLVTHHIPFASKTRMHQPSRC